MTSPAGPSFPSQPSPEPSIAHSRSAGSGAGPRKLTLLAVDDSPSDLSLLSRAVRGITDWDVELLTCLGAAECLALLENRPVDLVLIDYLLGAVTGVQLLREVRQAGTTCPVIFLTGRGDERVAVEALQSGAADYMLKDDLSSGNLKRAVEGALEKRNLQLAIAEYRKRLERTRENLEKRNAQIQGHYRAVTHELSTPLSTALELLAALLDGNAGPLTEDQADLVQSVRDSCGEISACLDDVGDVGRLERGSPTLTLRPDDVGEIVQRVAGMLSARADKLGVKLENRVAAGMGLAVMDRHRITQVVTTLVENALESTPAGSRVEIEAQEDPCDPAFLSIAVTDAGSGVPPEELEVIQAAFLGSDTSDDSAPGLGRGLGLCRKLVRMHGGEISVESEAAGGTIFAFTLPRARASDDLPDASAGPGADPASADPLA